MNSQLQIKNSSITKICISVIVEFSSHLVLYRQSEKGGIEVFCESVWSNASVIEHSGNIANVTAGCLVR